MKYETRARQIREWFSSHKASLKTFQGEYGNEEIYFLKWANPNSIDYHINYIFKGCLLYVSGDLYCAIYRWSQPVGLNFLASLNLQYFSEKCEASPEGRGYLSWDCAEAKRYIKEYLSEEDYNPDGHKYSDLENDWIDLSSEREWFRWLDNYGSKYFGSDFSCLSGAGEVIAMMCQAHLEGLKLAFKQINGD